MPKYTLEELEKMPTLSEGHFDNLKIEKPGYRVWISRMTVADGMPYNNQVTVERLKNGNWVTVELYEPKKSWSAGKYKELSHEKYLKRDTSINTRSQLRKFNKRKRKVKGSSQASWG